MPPTTPFWDGVLRRLGQDIPVFALDAWVACLGVEERPDGLRIEANYVPGKGHLGKDGRLGPGRLVLHIGKASNNAACSQR